MVAWTLLETQLLPSLSVHWQGLCRPQFRPSPSVSSGGQPPQASGAGRRALSGAPFPVQAGEGADQGGRGNKGTSPVPSPVVRAAVISCRIPGVPSQRAGWKSGRERLSFAPSLWSLLSLHILAGSAPGSCPGVAGQAFPGWSPTLWVHTLGRWRLVT